MRAKNICAFSLAEMMVVMLILSIVAAATLPIITRRSHSTDSIWQWASNNSDAYFAAGATQGAILGTSAFASGDATSKLMINTPSLGPNHIMFKQGETETGHLVVDASGNVGLGKVDLGVAPPSSPVVTYAVAIGSGTTAATADESIAIGYNAIANGSSPGVAIGSGASADTGGVALGSSAKSKSGSVAIGPGAIAGQKEDTAVGYLALASKSITSLNSNNTAIGYSALRNDPNSYNNTAVGTSAMYNNTDGGNNVSVGFQSLHNATNVNSNVAIGVNAILNNLTGNNNVGIGKDACFYVKGSNKICIGTNSGPASGSAWAADTDTVERVFIGGASKYNGGTAVLEVHNVDTTNNMTANISGYSNNNTGVVINGNLLVKGRIYVRTKYDSSDSIRDDIINYESGNGRPHFEAGNNGGNELWSDRRLKNVGKPFDSSLDKINRLKVYNFTYKSDKSKKQRVGVIAQDLEKIFPNAISKDPEGYRMIRTDDMFYAMLNSIKDLDKIVQGLVNDVKALVIKVQKIDDKIAAIIKVDQINSQKIKKLEAENAQLKNQNKAFETRLKRLELKVR